MAEQERDELGRFAGTGGGGGSDSGKAKSEAADKQTDAASENSYSMLTKGNDAAYDHAYAAGQWDKAKELHEIAAEHHRAVGQHDKARGHDDSALNAAKRAEYHRSKQAEKGETPEPPRRDADLVRFPGSSKSKGEPIPKLKSWAKKKTR